MYKKKTYFLIMTSILILLACLVVTVSSMAISKTKITMWTAYPEICDFAKSAAERYGKLNPNIEIEVTLFAQRALEEKVSAALPVGAGPDLLDLQLVSVYPYHSAGLMEVVPEDVADWARKNLPASVIKNNTDRDKLIILPIYISVGLMFYNKDHFQEAGLTIPPKDIDEQMMYAKKLVKYDAEGNITRAGLDFRLSGGASGTAEKFWTQAMCPYGVRSIVPVGDKWQTGYDNEWGQKALKYYLDAIYTYKVESLDIKSDAEGFGLGLSSMFQRESWVMSYLRDYAPNINYGVFPMPKGPNGWGGVATTQGISVPKSSAHKKEAWAFAKWLLNDDNSVKFFIESGWQPVRTNVDYSEVYKVFPAARVFVEILQNPEYEAFEYDLMPAIDEIQTRQAEQLMILFKKPELLEDPEKLAKSVHDMANETNRILSEYDLLAK